MKKQWTRRPKTQRAVRTRANNTWSENQYFQFIRSLLRSGSRKWPATGAALKAAQFNYTGPNKRQKWWYQCAQCKKMFKGDAVVVDHIVPLACGGLDHPSNMQWQTKAEAKAKDRTERIGC